MTVREWVLRPACKRDFEKLASKHPSLNQSVRDLLNRIARRGPTRLCNRLRHLEGAPVYKVRVPIQGRGLNRAARLIYHCDETQVVGLFLFVKGDKENLPPDEIVEALKGAGLG